jgi:oligoendopeptidase F
LRGTLQQGPRQVLEVLTLADELDQRVSKLFAYALLARDQDTRDTAAAERYERAVHVGTVAGRASAWIAPELLTSYDDAALLGLVEQEPGLAPFRRLLERLVRERPHVRSAEVEQLLAETMPLAQAPATAFTLLDNADIRYGTVTDIDGQRSSSPRAAINSCSSGASGGCARRPTRSSTPPTSPTGTRSLRS